MVDSFPVEIIYSLIKYSPISMTRYFTKKRRTSWKKVYLFLSPNYPPEIYQEPKYSLNKWKTGLMNMFRKKLFINQGFAGIITEKKELYVVGHNTAFQLGIKDTKDRTKHSYIPEWTRSYPNNKKCNKKVLEFSTQTERSTLLLENNKILNSESYLKEAEERPGWIPIETKFFLRKNIKTSVLGKRKIFKSSLKIQKSIDTVGNEKIIKVIRLFGARCIYLTNMNRLLLTGDNLYGILGTGEKNKDKNLYWYQDLEFIKKYENDKIIQIESKDELTIILFESGKIIGTGIGLIHILDIPNVFRWIELYSPGEDVEVSQNNSLDSQSYGQKSGSIPETQMNDIQNNNIISRSKTVVLENTEDMNNNNADRAIQFCFNKTAIMILLKSGKMMVRGYNHNGILGIKSSFLDDIQNETFNSLFRQTFNLSRTDSIDDDRTVINDWMETKPNNKNKNDRIIQISCSSTHSFILYKSGKMFGTGANYFGLYGSTKIKNKNGANLNGIWNRVKLQKKYRKFKIIYVKCYENCTFVILNNGKILFTGECRERNLGTIIKYSKTWTQVFPCKKY